ncbi:unnamed protein product [Phaedon cochleariae]|uniref:MADF domain-containing protein n=1 Tax=Phaedon cochleariae TaxID=80249 RepID=A0A9N9X0S0_PHACE|nr:unnamed protein product [Phaedon cochleariae]
MFLHTLGINEWMARNWFLASENEMHITEELAKTPNRSRITRDSNQCEKSSDHEYSTSNINLEDGTQTEEQIITQEETSTNKTNPEVQQTLKNKNNIPKRKCTKRTAEESEDVQEDVLRKRWEHLKDQYRKELKKQPLRRSGSEGNVWESSWQYYDLMTFMKDEVMPAPSTGNLSSVNQTNDDSQKLEDIGNAEEDTEMRNESDNSESEVSEPVISPPPRPSPTPSPCSSRQSSNSSRKRLNEHTSLNGETDGIANISVPWQS